MNQSKIESMIETLLNIGSGFIISMFVWAFIIVPYLGISNDFGQTVFITAIFTIISIVRGYMWRRFFNAGIHKIVHKFITNRLTWLYYM